MENNQLNFTGVTADSRKVRPGFVFIAIQGEEQDGNQFIDEAVQKGAKLIITEKDLIQRNIPYLQVKDARKALGNMNALFYSLFKNNIICFLR
jgi:UDP-N-acetylmuramoyl-L-alanyl-D-glutamate--2,6-diaminopimelate ligase